MTTTEAALAGWALLFLLTAGIAVLIARRAHPDLDETKTQEIADAPR